MQRSSEVDVSSAHFSGWATVGAMNPLGVFRGDRRV